MRGNEPTAMELAFINCRLPQPILDSPLVSRMVGALERRINARGRQHQDKGWNANLSYRTYRGLVSKGAITQ
jgi:hypothetical protein